MTVHEPRIEAKKSRSRLGRKLVAIVGASALAAGVGGLYATGANATVKHAALSGNLSITFNTFDYTTLDTILQSWEALNPGVHVTVVGYCGSSGERWISVSGADS